MERKIFVVFSVVLPVISILFVMINALGLPIFFQGLSILVCSFLYVGVDEEEKQVFYLKSILYTSIVGIMVYLVLSGEANKFGFLFMMIAVSLNVIHAKEVRKNRGWPALIE